jgi:hypothetical protein
MANSPPDAFSPGVPLAPDAPTSIVETQRVGGTYWQQRKLVEEERRLDAIAKRAANKQMAHAEANPSMFKRGYLDGNGMFVAYEDNEPGHETDRTAPAPHLIDPILEQMESRPANGSDHPAGTRHVVERMTEAEQAQRNARRQISHALTYIPMARLLDEGNAALESAYRILELQGADLSVGTIMTMHEGDSVKVRWDR